MYPSGHRRRFAVMCSPLHGTIVLEETLLNHKVVPQGHNNFHMEL